METRGKLKMVIAVCILIAGLAAPGPAKIIYVDVSATGTANGTSWGNAFPSLVDALAMAGPGDEVRVAQGIYKPNQGVTAKPYPSGPRARAIREYPAFRLKTAMTLRGGFAGVGANDPDARDVKRYETILSGDVNGNDAPDWRPGDPVYESTRADNNRIVVDSGAAVLDGLVVQSATDSGLLNTNGGLRVTNCTFRWNSGAGVRCSGGQSDLENCLFQENSRTFSGGGITVSGDVYRTVNGMETAWAYLTLRECRFVGNSATSTGGAISAGLTHLSLIGCSFEANTAGTGAAIDHFQGYLTLRDCRFENNLASQRGGAVSLRSMEMSKMTRCLFRGNRAPAGGAISTQEASLVLDSDIFSGNQAQHGGAMEAVAGWSSLPPGTNDIFMRGCLFTGNRGLTSGGALYAGPRASFTISNCTFADNWAPTAGQPGNAAFVVTMDNSILWDGSESIAPALYVSTHSVERVPSVTIRYSDVRGGWPGEGNINADPLFSKPGHWEDGSHPGVPAKPNDPNAVWIEGDYHVKSQAGRWDPAKKDWTSDNATSPCIDAGDPTSPFADEPEPNGGRINMGAYGGTAEASKSYGAR